MHLYAGTIRELSTECPTIPDCPTQQPVTCPPEATTPETIPGSIFVMLVYNNIMSQTIIVLSSMAHTRIECMSHLKQVLSSFYIQNVAKK